MKVVNQQLTVKDLDADTFESSKFGISMGPKMFHILSDGLYSDKIMACIRELSTNALDSHIANGNENVPPDVHLPTWSLPEYWIRDYGTGMSKDTVRKVFSIYGTSSKDTSDLFTGCLGLGSKTPFSYNTRTFTIMSWYNGMQYTWRCHLDKEGIPTLTLLGECHSNEKSGVKISFPTVKGDEYAFKSKAEQVYRYFKVKPNFVSVKLVIPTVQYTMTGKDWGLRNDGRAAHLIMGSISYPISTSSLDSKYRNIVGASVDVFAKIGDVSIEVSREGLSYDPKTIQYISNRLDDFLETATKQISGDLNKCQTLWEARITLPKIYDKLDKVIKSIIPITAFKWNNQVVFDSVYCKIDTSIIPNYNRHTIFGKRGYYTTSRVTSYTSHDIAFQSDVPQLFYNDMKIGGIVRARTQASLSGKNVYVFDLADPVYKKGLLDLLGTTDDSIFKPLSSVVYTPIKKPRAARAKMTTGMEFVPGSSYVTRQWKSVAIDLNTPGVYVELKKFDTNNSKWTGYKLYQLYRFLASQKIVPATIVGVKDKLVKDVQNAKFVHLDDYMKGFLEGILSANIANVLRRSPGDILTLFSSINSKVVSKDDIKFLKTFANPASGYDYDNMYDSYKSVYGEYSVIEDARKRYDTIVDNIGKKYPLLVLSDANTSLLPHVIEYITLIDAK